MRGPTSVRTALADRLLGWPGDLSPTAQSVPLRLGGALHVLGLDGSDPGHAAGYLPNEAGDDAFLSEAGRAMSPRSELIPSQLDLPPQTNEVRHSGALIPGVLWMADAFGLPLVPSELRASAGLNLMFGRDGLVVADRRFGATGSQVTLRPD